MMFLNCTRTLNTHRFLECTPHRQHVYHFRYIYFPCCGHVMCVVVEIAARTHHFEVVNEFVSFGPPTFLWILYSCRYAGQRKLFFISPLYCYSCFILLVRGSEEMAPVAENEPGTHSFLRNNNCQGINVVFLYSWIYLKVFILINVVIQCFFLITKFLSILFLN